MLIYLIQYKLVLLYLINVSELSYNCYRLLFMFNACFRRNVESFDETDTRNPGIVYLNIVLCGTLGAYKFI